MRSNYYSALARVRLIIRSDALSPLRDFIAKVPFFHRTAQRAKFVMGRVLLRHRTDWVKVESGLAEGFWLRLRFFGEGSYWLGYHERTLQNLLKPMCKMGSVCYDIGAHLGFFSLGLANCVGPKGRVFAFEADPENCARLKEIVIRNNLQDRVELVEAAAWAYTSSGVPFRRGGSKAHGGICADGITPVLADRETRLVPTVSLDDFVRKGNPLPDIVKVDVEGGECAVLKGGEEVFSQSRVTLFCEVHHEQASRWISDWLAAKGYATEWRIPKESYPRLLVAQRAGCS
jgi:FkbM family methyltransferase